MKYSTAQKITNKYVSVKSTEQSKVTKTTYAIDVPYKYTILNHI